MKNTTPMRAIRLKCLDCCCGSFAEVRQCTATKCPLHPYRYGKRPSVPSKTENSELSSDSEEIAVTPCSLMGENNPGEMEV